MKVRRNKGVGGRSLQEKRGDRKLRTGLVSENTTHLPVLKGTIHHILSIYIIYVIKCPFLTSRS